MATRARSGDGAQYKEKSSGLWAVAIELPPVKWKSEERRTPMSERERIEQSNEVAGIVFDEHKKAWPDLHPVLDLRYGIADALWEAGYRKVTS